MRGVSRRGFLTGGPFVVSKGKLAAPSILSETNIIAAKCWSTTGEKNIIALPNKESSSVMAAFAELAHDMFNGGFTSVFQTITAEDSQLQDPNGML